MSTESETILARYKAVEKEGDALGRVIGVRRLKPSEQTKISGFCSDLTGYDVVELPNGEKTEIPHSLPLRISASVCLIDGVHIPFPKSRAELDAIYDRLDAEGITAANAALGRMLEADPKNQVEEAKN
jgi:hypothetical protein